MLYYLFRFLSDFGVPGSGMWSYISFRSLLAFIVALLISAWFGQHFISYMRRKNISETQRDASIDPFGVQKQGVPSMGGIIIIVSILVPCLLLGRLRNIYMLLMLLTTVWFGVLGFADDYIKIFKHNKDGLHAKAKILGQVVLGLAVGLTLYLSPDAVIRENITTQRSANNTEVIVHKSEPVKSTITTIPFFKNNNLSYTNIMSFCGKYKGAAGWILFVLVTVLVITAVSNGANLNDGMDGMAAGNSAIIGGTLGILAYVSSHIEYASYLNIMYIPGSEELVIFICALVGALIGFLWYNAFPAQVFMGDTGSLTGGIIAVFAIIIHKELLIPILCGIFLAENLSVILQVKYFQAGKKKGVKQRVFKRTPIHDHFRTTMAQLDPQCRYLITKPSNVYHESKITVRFWIVTIVLAAITIITLKIR